MSLSKYRYITGLEWNKHVNCIKNNFREITTLSKIPGCLHTVFKLSCDALQGCGQTLDYQSYCRGK